PAPESNFVRDP
uniref:Extended FMRFamide-10 n=1 Tax=Namaquaphasma ookiepense TaxID=409167 RepID=FAR10_NAMOO|nr:RecName: Full=Extended FMRFamide-10; Short=FMRFa-10 [Namaquaphasma ookiepense]